jgi:hypothetical protein
MDLCCHHAADYHQHAPHASTSPSTSSELRISSSITTCPTTLSLQSPLQFDGSVILCSGSNPFVLALRRVSIPFLFPFCCYIASSFPFSLSLIFRFSSWRLCSRMAIRSHSIHRVRSNSSMLTSANVYIAWDYQCSLSRSLCTHASAFRKIFRHVIKEVLRGAVPPTIQLVVHPL